MVAKIGDFDGDDRRHQWGAETSTQPLAIMHAKPSPTRVVLGYVAIICTVVSWLIYMITMILSLFVNNPSLTLRFVVEGVLYMTIVTTLIFSALVYLTTRQGALYRFIRHERVPRAMLDDHFAHNYDKGITVLIPSYVEQPKVVEKTIWSAALQEFPDLAVVLLIDDPPHPNNDEARAILKASRELMRKYWPNWRHLRNVSPKRATKPLRRSPIRWTQGVVWSHAVRKTIVRPRNGWSIRPTHGWSKIIPTISSAIRYCAVLHATCV